MSEIPIIDDVPARVNFKIRRGVTFSRTLTRTNQDGTPIDITGQTFVGKIIDTDGVSVLETFTIAIIDGPNGIMRISLTSIQTAALALGTFPYYVTYTTVGGDIFMLLLGDTLVVNIASS